MRSTLIILQLFCTASTLWAQIPPDWYLQAVSRADSLYAEKQYDAAAHVFSDAFKKCPNCIRWTDKYNAACGWALAGNTDNALANMMYVANTRSYTKYNQLVNDRDLESLHGSKKWNEIVNKVRANRDSSIAHPDFKLVYMFDTIYRQD